MTEGYPADPPPSRPRGRRRPYFPRFRSAFDLADYLYVRGIRLQLGTDGDIVEALGSEPLGGLRKVIAVVEPIFKQYLVAGRTIRPTILCARYEEAHRRWRDGGRVGDEPSFRSFAASYAATLPPPCNAPGTRARRIEEAVRYAIGVLRRPVVERRSTTRPAPSRQVDALPSGVFFRVRGRP